MARISTTELINKIFMFCQAYSGVEFFPYQAQFAKRIIRSVLENDGDEITALFSRQCLTKGQRVLMSDWIYKPIEEVQVGDKVMAFDYDSIVPKEVINAYCAGVRDTYQLTLRNGKKIRATSNHRFLHGGSRLFKQLADFEVGDTIGYREGNKIKFSRIRNLNKRKEELTYDLEVECAENFICEEFLVHNSGKSETVATISGGLAIILPKLANLPMFAGDLRLEGFRNGLMVGIFAPTLNQAQISFNRMKKRMGSKSAQEVMGDPEVDVSFDISNGQNIILSNNSLIRCQSASDGSNIEGDSYMLIIVDEAQDVSNFKYLKCLSEDTEIWLPNGSKDTIKNVVNKKKNVVTLDGERTPEEFYNNGVQEVFEIKLSNGRLIKATSNHQFFVRRRVGNRVPKWDTLNNVSIGDTIAVPKKVAYFGDKYNIRQGQLVGFMLGDGCMTGDQPLICMNKAVRDRAINHILRDFPNTEYHETRYSESKDLSEGYFRRKSRKGNKEGELITFLKELGIWGLKGSDKVITPQIFGASKNFLKGLVMGLIESDGCVTNDGVVFSNTSENLVRGLQDILLKFGVPSRVSVRENNGTFTDHPKPIWSCTIKSAEGVLEFYRNFELFTKQKKLYALVDKKNSKDSRKSVSDNRRGKFRDDIYFERVVSITSKGLKPTYCLKVEGRNFIANGIVSSNSISPMGAFYNATKILIGTATVTKGFFYDSIARNKEEHDNGGKRNNFEYDYNTVIKYNPKYEKYVTGEKKRLGENSDEFKMSYCVTPETKILTSDLRWVRADSIKKGDKLVGFDENPPKRYGQRKFKESIVEDIGVIERPCYRVTLDDGKVVTCSEEHQWLVFTAGSRTQWKMTKDLVSTDRIYRVCNVWDDPVYKTSVNRGKSEFRFLGSVKCSNGHQGSEIHPRVKKVTFLGNRKVIPIRTSTRTYIAEGLASHNCLKWILERGMFFDPVVFDKMKEPSMGLSLMDTLKSHVVGIDLGKKSDSTIITVLEVDWNNPFLVEKSQHGDTGIPDYVAYNTCVKAWLEIQGDNWNEQYDIIMDFINNFNVARIVMDGTGVGDAIYDRMRANLDIEVIPYVFSRQSKSDLYKHLNTEARAGRVHYPADETTQETREYKSFSQQCLDLEKSYSGQMMVVSHPNVRGAHDDYCDSLALAVWGAKGEGVSRPQTENGSFYPKAEASFTKSRNRLTARRR